MNKKKILWYLYPSYLTVIFLPLALVYWITSGQLTQFYLDQIKADLHTKLALVEEQLFDLLLEGNQNAIDLSCKALGKKSHTRFTLINAAGKVLGDTDKDPQTMDNHIDRPEVINALTGNEDDAVRYSFTLHEKMIYAVVPLRKNGEIKGALRASMPVEVLNALMNSMRLKFITGGLIAAMLAGIISFFAHRSLGSMLLKIKTAAERFARGEFESMLRIPDSVEFGDLAEAMNRIAVQLNDRLQTVIQQTNEQEAVLASMVEGVLAVDVQERIIRINRAAAKMLSIGIPSAQGKSIQATIKNSDLQKFVKNTLLSRDPIEEEILMEHNSDEWLLQAHGTALQNEKGESFGALIVLNDITRLKRLENLRQDFVANVSHELKTPITSIKGSVETLIEGALLNQEDAKKFLDIIARHAERLSAIIDDLLSLSSIEQMAKRSEVLLKEGNIRDVVESAIQACTSKAVDRSVHIKLNYGEDIQSRFNASLLEQAVVNLLDNAIKYSDPGQTIQIDVERAHDEVIINVQDHGCGIEEEYLPRLFERFYRVDKGRSRQLGGTGLGLAIVKHIVAAHAGSVTVQSSVGKGSLFSIHLPA